MFDFVIYLCSYGMTNDETAKCIDRLHTQTRYNFEARWVTRDALIGRSRSRAASQFLFCEDSPFMIFVDGDIIFQPADIEGIYRSLQAGYHVVGGVYSVADGTFVPVQAYKALPFDGQIYEMKYVSTGFMGISRVALKTVRDKLNLPHLHKGEWCECWPFFESGGLRQEKIYISEDWDFCNKVRGAGLQVHLHTGVRVGHIKQRVIPGEEAICNMVQKTQALTGVINTECLVQSTLVDDLAEFLNISIEDLGKQLLDNPPAKHAQEWRDWKGSAGDFYKENKTQFVDLALFNTHTAYWQDRVNPIGGQRDSKILDFGCGIGSASLFLAQNRNEVIGYDINPRLIDFCNFRRDKLGFSHATFTTEMPDLADFDLVVAIDVLEHLENLRDFLLKLGQGMKSGAKLYHADCPKEVLFIDTVNPMHFDHTKDIDGWLKEAGFIPWDARWAIRGGNV